MSNYRSALLDQYGRQELETAETMAMSFYDIAQRSLQASVDWQKFLLHHSANMLEISNSIVDAITRRNLAFIGAVLQQFDSSLTMCRNLTRRWSEDLDTVQNKFASVSHRATQETPPRPPPNKGDTPEIVYSQTYKTAMREDISKLAYALWQQRGCPADSAERDWIEAEQQL